MILTPDDPIDSLKARVAAEFVLDGNGVEDKNFTKNADERLPSASMTKIMTGLLLEEAVKRNHWSWDATIKLQPHSDMGEAYSHGSKLGAPAGTEMTLREALTIMMVISANDVANTVAVLVGNSVTGFVAMMNERKAQLGMDNTEFDSPSGYARHADKVVTNFTSARDQATLMFYATNNAPELAKAMRTPFVIFKNKAYGNHDLLLTGAPKTKKHGPVEKFEGMQASKTGTLAGWYCLAAEALRNGHGRIAVVIGAPNADTLYRVASQSLGRGYRLGYQPPPAKDAGGTPMPDYSALLSAAIPQLP